MAKLAGEKSGLSRVWAWLNKDRSGPSFGAAKDKQFFLENLSLLTGSGLGVAQSLEAIEFEMKTRHMREITAVMRRNLESGYPLWHALEIANLFPTYTIALLKIGEESGRLSENLKIIGNQQAKETTFKSQLRAAMMYPLFVLMLTLVIGIGIAWFILPKLANVFSSINAKLPLITRVVLKLGEILQNYGWLIIPLSLLVGGLCFYLLFLNRKTNYLGKNFLCRLPGIGRLIQELEVARFGYLLGTLLDAGIQVTQALDSLEKATAFPHYQALYSHLRRQIDQGDSFKTGLASFSASGRLIPRPIQQLVVAGEQSGSLTDILGQISRAYEAKVEITTKNLTVILEPILLLIVWLGVLGVALSVILPVYGLIGGFNTHNL